VVYCSTVLVYNSYWLLLSDEINWVTHKRLLLVLLHVAYYATLSARNEATDAPTLLAYTTVKTIQNQQHCAPVYTAINIVTWTINSEKQSDYSKLQYHTLGLPILLSYISSVALPYITSSSSSSSYSVIISNNSNSINNIEVVLVTLARVTI
jgi:hypothetical protein